MSGRPRFYAACLVGLLVLVGCGSSGTGTGTGSSSGGSAMGQLQEEDYFTLKNLNGEDVSLQSVLREKRAVLLNFWATWCPPCREEIPGLIRLQEKHQGQGFEILGIDVGESAKQVSAFAKKMGINYPLLLDMDSAVAEHYSVVGIPTSILITSDGTVVGEYHGYTKKLVSDVEKALQ